MKKNVETKIFKMSEWSCTKQRKTGVREGIKWPVKIQDIQVGMIMKIHSTQTHVHTLSITTTTTIHTFWKPTLSTLIYTLTTNQSKKD